MKSVITATAIGSLLLTATAFTAEAARQKCGTGTFWSKAKGACVAAGSQAKPQQMCMTFTSDGSPTQLPCSSL